MTTVKPEWKWAGHMSGDRCITMYRDKSLGVQMEQWCNRREGDGPAGYEYYGGGTSFFIDGDKKEYKTEAAMLEALGQRAPK